MQGARKQQETQHAVHQRFVEVDLSQHTDNQRINVRFGDEGLDEHERQRGGKCDQNQADGMRGPQVLVIDVSEQRR